MQDPIVAAIEEKIETWSFLPKGLLVESSYTYKFLLYGKIVFSKNQNTTQKNNGEFVG